MIDPSLTESFVARSLGVPMEDVVRTGRGWGGPRAATTYRPLRRRRS